MVETLRTGTGGIRDYTEIRASQLFEKFRKKYSLVGLIAQARGKVTDLLSLNDVIHAHDVSQHWAEGQQAVNISQIRGSSMQGRAADFDGDFRPLQDRTRARWVGIATARSKGSQMPPVRLTVIRGINDVDDIYFVEDGHHRISVARALGEETIQAEITVIHVSKRAA